MSRQEKIAELVKKVSKQEVAPDPEESLFADGFGDYFYRRRIGGLPRFRIAADDVALPAQVRILGAVAAGGYVAPRTQIAALAAVTDRADADAVIAGVRRRIPISPLTAWGAARIEQQLGASVLAATGTIVQRDLPDGLRDLLAETAFAASADAKLRTADGTYELALFAGLSGIYGTADAIKAIETSSTHYYQRPDQNYLHLDDGAKHLVGADAGFVADKRAGMWQASIYGQLQTPGFDINDVGVLHSADDIDASVDVRRAVTLPTDKLFSWETGGGLSTEWNFGGLRKQVDAHAYANATLPSFSSGSINADVTLPGGSDDETRGGPIMQLGWASALSLSASSPHGRAQQLSGSINLQLSPTLQQGIGASMSLASRLTPALRLDVTPSVTWVETHRQYVDTVADPTATDTFGDRYVFGHLHRKEASLQLRATWSLSPDLVLTVYAQPFASVGSYDQLGELAKAGAADVHWYASTLHDGANRSVLDGTTRFQIAEPDFSIVSLRSTAVLRWEPSPGSSVYIVWQQARGGAGEAIARPLHDTFPDIFTQRAIHTIAVKFSYWFG